ncbi:MAG TPA: hypothetical protein DCQ64_24560 [Candidatus Rokubacteria bacterium]|nr:hypothetical protein [Candidatus Rokubacteria bacterium]
MGDAAAVHERVEPAPLSDLIRWRLEGQTLPEIAQRLGVSVQAVSKRLRGIWQRIDAQQDKAFQEYRPQILRAAQRAMLVDIFNPEKRAKASTGNAAYALRQLHDIERLETGQSTANVALHALVESIERERATPTRGGDRQISEDGAT